MRQMRSVCRFAAAKASFYRAEQAAGGRDWESEAMRKHYRFYGEVQGVGFRYRASQAARSLELTGWVRNDYDGSVEMELQGTEAEIDRVVEMIQAGRYVDIIDMEVKKLPEVVGERGFDVRM